MTLKKITLFLLITYSLLFFLGCTKNTTEQVQKKIRRSESTKTSTLRSTDDDENSVKTRPSDTTTTFDSDGNEVKTIRGFID